ncbi:Protein of unknown function [Pyronema omphalodes CBS 100304]|uniref:Uncharacterized protein n=1 Tax=Pyronema omphalodes (strain CBS 100304) TaxID=1076935 RepID=U4KXB7_PYROM|nr:Protein of unknown function [Pyronema omphalodes CBS 100304]
MLMTFKPRTKGVSNGTNTSRYDDSLHTRSVRCLSIISPIHLSELKNPGCGETTMRRSSPSEGSEPP